ncbi:MAG TPA: nucleotidyltransferase family protein [Allosphingosinicella sp.]|nr:nucleotidyltransferase family protein [Allosphingosinicella sp.]
MLKGPPEFVLAVACCRWPLTPERLEAVRAAAVGTDWHFFARVAERHRVEALVWNALRQAQVDVPAEIRASFSAAAGRTALQNLELAAEAVAIRDSFAAEGIETIFVKGISLAMLAYGSLSLKAGWDIDVLIPPEKLLAAEALLRRDGYDTTEPASPVSSAHLSLWHRISKESVWRDGRGRHIELHTRLTDNALLIPTIGVGSAVRDVEVGGGVTLRTLGERELFAYLCVHGASSAWFRLKWLADLAALVAGKDETEIAALYDSSQALGAGRAADLALLLARRLFETPVPDALVRRLESDPVNRWLAATAMKTMAGRGVATEPTAIRLGTLPIHLLQFGLGRGIRFKLHELRRQLANPKRAIRRAQ